MTAARLPAGAAIVLVDGVDTLWHLPHGANPEGLTWPTLCGLTGAVWSYGPWARQDRHVCGVCAARAPAGLLETPKPPPRKRPGRPRGSGRKTTDAQIRALHLVHWEQRVPINELGRRYWQKLGFASANACANTLSHNFRDLGLPRHDRIAMTVQASTRHGMARRAAPKGGGRFGNGAKARGYKRWLLNERAGGETRNPVCAATTARGKPCTHRALDGSDVCYSHDPARAAERAANTAAMRLRSPLRNRVDLEDAAPLAEELAAFRSLGGSWRTLSRAADVPDHWLCGVAHGKQREVATGRASRVRDALRTLTAPALAEAA